MEDSLDLVVSDNILLHNGFPNPAKNRLTKSFGLDLNHLLIKHPSSSFVFRVSGHAYNDQGIYDGDLIIVDKALSPAAADLIIAWQDNSFRLVRQYRLDSELSEWGVVSTVIRITNKVHGT